MSNSSMAWLCVDQRGDEYVSNEMPHRCGPDLFLDFVYWSSEIHGVNTLVLLPWGTIELLTGKVLTWHDEPIKIDDISDRYLSLIK